MLWSVAFDRVGVVLADIYFVDPNPGPGQEGAERGVRLELRAFDREPLLGSIYSAVPVRVGHPIWRVDLLESVTSPPGSLDRVHHHPRFEGWEPGRRVFVAELSTDPVAWVRARFAAIEAVLDEAGCNGDQLGPRDVDDLRTAGPLVVAALERALEDVRVGRAARPPSVTNSAARNSWL